MVSNIVAVLQDKEAVMRLINADALIENFGKLTVELWLDSVEEAEIVSLMGNAPTIEPKRGAWIPCSERLPSESGRYLVTFPTLINKPWIDILWYGRPTFPETDHPCFYASDDEYGDVEYDDVVAWMPLPEPYREREGE